MFSPGKSHEQRSLAGYSPWGCKDSDTTEWLTLSTFGWVVGKSSDLKKVHLIHLFSSVQSLSHVQLFATPWTAAHQASLSITNSQSLLKLMSIMSVMPSNHLILWRPLPLPPSNFPSIRVFSDESVLHIRWPKHWNFSFSISSSNDYSGLISFKMDWLDLLAVQGILKSLQYHSSKALILPCSAYFNSPVLTSMHDYWKKYSFD